LIPTPVRSLCAAASLAWRVPIGPEERFPAGRRTRGAGGSLGWHLGGGEETSRDRSSWLTLFGPSLCRMFALLLKTTLDGYIDYGAGDFDGEGSGHDFYGVRPHPRVPARPRGNVARRGTGQRIIRRRARLWDTRQEKQRCMADAATHGGGGQKLDGSWRCFFLGFCGSSCFSVRVVWTLQHRGEPQRQRMRDIGCVPARLP